MCVWLYYSLRKYPIKLNNNKKTVSITLFSSLGAVELETHSWKVNNMGPFDFSAGYPSSTSSFSWLSFCLLMGSGKHISLQGAAVDAAAHCCGPAGSAPLYYASQWERHRKVSVTRLWHLQHEGSKTLSFCFSTFPDTAHGQGHMPTVQDLQCSIPHYAECR